MYFFYVTYIASAKGRRHALKCLSWIVIRKTTLENTLFPQRDPIPFAKFWIFSIAMFNSGNPHLLHGLCYEEYLQIAYIVKYFSHSKNIMNESQNPGPKKALFNL